MNNITVTHRDNSQTLYNADMINKSIERACKGLDNAAGKVMQIAADTEIAIFPGITTTELDQATISAAVQNIKEDPDYDIIAKRLLLKKTYKAVLGDYDDNDAQQLKKLYTSGFVRYIQAGVKSSQLDPRFNEKYDLGILSQAIDITRDELLNYLGLETILKRYAFYDSEQKLLELPQYTWMRIAMAMSLPEKDSTNWAVRFYNKLSQLHYISGGSTNVNAGTRMPQMSNCYIMETHDSINHIAKTISDVMKLTKATGGIGLSVTKLRAEGSPVKSNNTFSSGPIPFMHVIDSTLRAVSRAGKKMGALCFYMENWHYNFAEFLDLKQNSGDEYRRTRTANTAVYISDEFMKRVKNNDYWYLFDPAETPDLNELYGQEFSKRYKHYVKQAESGQLRMFKKIKAREQFKSIIIMLQTTSHPWITFKDPINVRALNNNTGTIHSSNLCTEICLPQDENNVAVCNLASINLSRHLTDDREIDWKKMEESVRLAVRQLDNLLDINQSPIIETRHSDLQNRAIGLGIMGFTDMIQKKGIAYDSEDSYNLIDNIMEFISYTAIDASAELAQERGHYPNFHGSRWSEGLVPYDSISLLEKDRSLAIKMNRDVKLNWDNLRVKVKNGMRNATLMAIAPTANIGLVAGTTPGIDPQFSNIFARATNRGKFLEININLINALKKLNLWEDVKDNLVAKQGELSDIDIIPVDIKNIYKTSFQLNPRSFIEVASRAQKWIDQAISRNMYLETRDADEVMDIYMHGWDKGLKTFYYLHMKQRHTAEQSTARVNKSINIKGNNTSFGFGKSMKQLVSNKETHAFALNQPSVAKMEEVTLNKTGQVVATCPVDPQERLQCDSCQ